MPPTPQNTPSLKLDNLDAGPAAPVTPPPPTPVVPPAAQAQVNPAPVQVAKVPDINLDSVPPAPAAVKPEIKIAVTPSPTPSIPEVKITERIIPAPKGAEIKIPKAPAPIAAPKPLAQVMPQSPETEKTSAGPIIGVIIIVFMLALGGLYFWGAQLNREAETLPLIPGDAQAQ